MIECIYSCANKSNAADRYAPADFFFRHRYKMKTKYQLLVILLALSVSCCFMHTVKSMNYYFPVGSNSTNCEYYLWMECHGETRKAYTDKTKKSVRVGIQKGKNNVFLREYELLAASLESDVKWERVDDLTITFFDFDEGVSIYKKDIAYKSAKILFILHITYDPAIGKFIEYPIPEELKQKIKMGNRKSRTINPADRQATPASR